MAMNKKVPVGAREATLFCHHKIENCPAHITKGTMPHYIRAASNNIRIPIGHDATREHLRLHNIHQSSSFFDGCDKTRYALEAIAVKGSALLLSVHWTN